MSNRDMGEYLLNYSNETKTAKYLGVSRQRLHRWRENPDNLPLWAAKKLALLRGYRMQIVTITHTYT